MYVRSGISVALLILCGLLSSASSAFAHGGTVTVRVRTESEIINALAAANASGKPTVIKVAPGHYRFSMPFDLRTIQSVLPPITGSVLILAHDPADTVFDLTEGSGRFLTVLAGGRLIVQNLAIAHGYILCNISYFDDDFACFQPAGAAAANFGGVLWFVNCFLSDNKAYTTSDENFSSGQLQGGAIYSGGGILRLENTTVTGNDVRGVGAGVAVVEGVASIHHSIIRSNRVTSFTSGSALGGGVYASGTKLTISDSTISGNTGPDGYADFDEITLGAGIYNERGNLRILDSAITENVTPFGGAGGGIFNTGLLFVQNSTIGGNTSGVLGGGIYNTGRVTLNGVTLARNLATGSDASGDGSHAPSFPPGCHHGDAENTQCVHGGGGIWNDPAGVVQIQSSVIAENAFNWLDFISDCNGALRSEGHNALGAGSDCRLQNYRVSDQVGVDVRLGELRDNGEPGNAHYPLLANSPLIDAGGKVFKQCTPHDQIGVRRKDGDSDGFADCDVGAVEFRPKRAK